VTQVRGADGRATFSETINLMPSVTVQLAPNALTQVVISVVKQVSVSGSVSYAATLSGPSTLEPIYGYPSAGVLLTMNPQVSVESEQRESVLVLIGAITGAWSAILAAYGLLERALFRVCYKNAVENVHAESGDVEMQSNK
jgi:hypothetical protein